MVLVGTSLNHLPFESVGAEAFDGNRHSLFAVYYVQSCAFKHKCTLQEHTGSGSTILTPPGLLHSNISFLSGNHVQEQPLGFQLKATSHLIEHSTAWLIILTSSYRYYYIIYIIIIIFLLRIWNKVMVSLYEGNVDNIYTSWSAVVTLTLASLFNSILVARLTQLITYCQSWNGSMSSKDSFMVQ